MTDAPMLPGFDQLAPKQAPARRRTRASRRESASAPLTLTSDPGARGAPEDGLNEQQRAAAHAPLDRPCLTIAGAGSGKTKTLIARYAYLRRQGVPANAIMTVAFNKAAADEVAQRAAAATGTRPILNGTFHALGFRILNRIRDRWNLPAEIKLLEDKEARKLVRDAIRELSVGDEVTDPKLALGAIAAWKNRGMTVEQAREEVRQMPRRANDPAWEDHRLLQTIYLAIYERYEAGKSSLERIDFADMLLMPVVSMREDAAVRRQFARGLQHILCDEYQDVNDCQYDFLHLLASEGAKLFCVGDDFQAIYGWRHARVEHILNFCDDHPDATRVTLVTNYRCSPEILAPANRVADGLSEKLADKHLEAAKPSGTRPVVCGFGQRGDEAADVAKRIQHEIDRGLKPSDMAVLSRTNRNLRGIEDQLMRLRIPYVVAGGSFWERAEIVDMLSYLEAIQDPGADEAFLRIVNAPSRRIGIKAIDRMRQSARRAGRPVQSPEALSELSGSQLTAAQTLTELLAGWRSRLSGGEPVSSVLAEVVSVTRYREHWRREPERMLERMENIQELIDAADGFGTPGELLEHARACRSRAGRKAKNAVVLSTIHRAKGLEWDTVFLIGCEVAVMPHAMASTAAELDEERRLAYVAFTRAARQLFVTFAWRGNAGGPSPFLIEVADLMDIREDLSVEAPAAGSGTHQRWHSAANEPGARRPKEPAWAETLGVSVRDPLSKVEAAYRTRAKAAHPDVGGSHAEMRELNVAIEMARAYHESRAQRQAA